MGGNKQRTTELKKLLIVKQRELGVLETKSQKPFLPTAIIERYFNHRNKGQGFSRLM